jgi:iron complex transport system substrate-binding protein
MRLLIVCTLSASCSKSGADAVRDAGPRVVSLSPSTTEAMFAISAGDQLVGRSRYCDHPREALALPVVGGFVDPNFETALGLRPTLVVGAQGPGGPQVAERFNALGVSVYFPRTESIPEIESMLRGLGSRTGHSREAEAWVQGMEATLARVAASVEGKPRPKTLLLFGFDPVVGAGPQSFPDEMLRRAGGDNVVREGPAYPTLGAEQLAAWDPDVILALVMGPLTGATGATESSFPSNRPMFHRLRAVREGRAKVVLDDALLRPGPRVADGVATLAKTLHPELP